ncbi:MAG: hypothetical protein ACHQ49_14875 [Elusimicrobiota bacterium]
MSPATPRRVVRRAGEFGDPAETLSLELEALVKTGLKGKELLNAAAKAVLSGIERSGEKFEEKRFADHELMLRVIDLATADEGCSLIDRGFAPAAFLGLCFSAASGRVGEGPLEKESDRVVSFFLSGSGATL